MSVRARLCAVVLGACAGGTATGTHDARPTDGPNGLRDGDVDGVSVDAASADASVDGPPPAVVRIEEVYVDQAGQGAGYEYIEISGTAGGSLDGLSVRVITSGGTSGAKHTYALSTNPGATMPSDGRWVIGGVLATGTDRTLSVSSSTDDWNLDGTAGAVQLLRATTAAPELVDVLGYGAAVTPAMSLSAPTATSETSHIPLPASGRSLGRRAGSADSNANADDFCGQTPSSGNANGACL